MGQEDFVALFRRLVESQKLDEDTAQMLLHRILKLLYGSEEQEDKPPDRREWNKTEPQKR